MKKSIVILGLAFLYACSYSVFMNAYPHLRYIQIYPIENSTSEFALGQDLQNFLVEKFQSDGRLKISTLDPDCCIEGKVLDYRNEIFSYDMYGSVSEYRVSILLDITMTDLKRQTVMYENKSLLQSVTYSPNASNPDLFITEAQAVDEVFLQVFNTIMRSTFEAW